MPIMVDTRRLLFTLADGYDKIRHAFMAYRRYVLIIFDNCGF